MVRKTHQPMFNLDLEFSKEKTRSVEPNVGRKLVAKETVTLEWKELEVIENSNIFDVCKDLYLTIK